MPAVWVIIARALSVPIARIVVAVVLWGLALTTRSWLQPVYEAMSHKRSFFGQVLRGTGVGYILKGLDWMTHRAAHRISHSTAANVAPVGRYLDAQAARTRAANAAAAAHADAVADAFTRLRYWTMPRAIHAQVRPVAVAVDRTRVRVGVLDRREREHWRRLRRGIDRIEHKAAAALLGFLGIDYLVKRHHKALHHAKHRTGDTIAKRTLPRLQNRVRSHGRRLTKLEKLVTVGAIGALVASFAPRRFPSWRCSSARNLRRNLRCLHWRWLEGLLFAGVDVLLIRDVCLLTRYIESGAATFAPVVHNLMVAGENFICGDTAHLASAIEPGDRAGSSGFASAATSATKIGRWRSARCGQR
jgi:hypothetical protein